MIRSIFPPQIWNSNVQVPEWNGSGGLRSLSPSLPTQEKPLVRPENLNRRLSHHSSSREGPLAPPRRLSAPPLHRLPPPSVNSAAPLREAFLLFLGLLGHILRLPWKRYKSLIGVLPVQTNFWTLLKHLLYNLKDFQMKGLSIYYFSQIRGSSEPEAQKPQTPSR